MPFAGDLCGRAAGFVLRIYQNLEFVALVLDWTGDVEIWGLLTFSGQQIAYAKTAPMLQNLELALLSWELNPEHCVASEAPQLF